MYVSQQWILSKYTVLDIIKSSAGRSTTITASLTSTRDFTLYNASKARLE